MTKFCSYLRVSTQRQGKSGLGLEGQREAIRRYLAEADGALLEEFVEIETGKADDRPILRAALARCKQAKATLVMAKLDRISRNVAFIANLMNSGVEFRAVDAPYANRFMLHILAAVAEHERDMISQRTKAALAAAKARGVVLGQHGKVLAEKNKADAMDFAGTMRAHLEEMLQGPGQNFAKLAALLNEKGIPTRDKGSWHPMSVKRVMNRLGLGFLAAPAASSSERVR